MKWRESPVTGLGTALVDGPRALGIYHVNVGIHEVDFEKRLS